MQFGRKSSYSKGGELRRSLHLAKFIPLPEHGGVEVCPYGILVAIGTYPKLPTAPDINTVILGRLPQNTNQNNHMLQDQQS